MQAMNHAYRDAAGYQTLCGELNQKIIPGAKSCKRCSAVKGASEWQERFWAKVDKTDHCWIWTAALNSVGYGVFRVSGKNKYAHRISFQLAGKTIPDGLVLDHLCRRTECLNPDHLEAVSYATNTQRGKTGPKQFCKHGHEFNLSNTYIRIDNGSRACKACGRSRNRIIGRIKTNAKYVYANCARCKKKFCAKSTVSRTIKYCSKMCIQRASSAAFKARKRAAGRALLR